MPQVHRATVMALKELPYPNVSALINDCLSTEEDEETLDLIHRLRRVRGRGYLTRGELEAVCNWKSARAIQHVKSNTASEVRRATGRALTARSERRRLAELTALRGVSVPMASAILMFLDPRRYGVIDIRVWQLLYEVGAVTKKPAGIAFDFNNWYQFLMIVRHFAKKLKVKARDIERTLFGAHQKYQKGRLYAISSRSRR